MTPCLGTLKLDCAPNSPHMYRRLKEPDTNAGYSATSLHMAQTHYTLGGTPDYVHNTGIHHFTPVLCIHTVIVWGERGLVSL